MLTWTAVVVLDVDILQCSASLNTEVVVFTVSARLLTVCWL